MAQTLDGHILQPDGRWRLSSAEDRRRMDKLREKSDCIIVSRSTLENDNPNLYNRQKPGQKKQPFPVVVLKDASKPVSSDLRVFKRPHRVGEFWVLNRNQGKPVQFKKSDKNGADNNKEKSLADRWPVYYGENVQSLVDSLSSRNCRQILLEGGPQLNAEFLKYDLVDELYFTQLPFLWGGKSTDRIVTGDHYLDGLKFYLKKVERRQSEVYFRYLRARRAPVLRFNH